MMYLYQNNGRVISSVTYFSTTFGIRFALVGPGGFMEDLGREINLE